MLRKLKCLNGPCMNHLAVTNYESPGPPTSPRLQSPAATPPKLRCPMKRLMRSLVLATAVIPAGVADLQGQPGPGVTRSYVQLVRLKPEMVTEWIRLQRTEVIPAQKKAGVASRTTLVTQVGDAFEYVIITPFPEWSAMDNPTPLQRALGNEGAAALNENLRKCVLVQQNYVVNRRDSLSVNPDNANDAVVWQTTTRQLAPGKTAQEYYAHYRADILPGMKRAKAMGHQLGSTVAARGMGAAAGEIVTVNHFAKFADLDKGSGLTAALGAEAAAAANAKGAGLTTVTRTVIRRRLPDLSF